MGRLITIWNNLIANPAAGNLQWEEFYACLFRLLEPHANTRLKQSRETCYGPCDFVSDVINRFPGLAAEGMHFNDENHIKNYAVKMLRNYMNRNLKTDENRSELSEEDNLSEDNEFGDSDDIISYLRSRIAFKEYDEIFKIGGKFIRIMEIERYRDCCDLLECKIVNKSSYADLIRDKYADINPGTLRKKFERCLEWFRNIFSKTSKYNR